MRQHPILRGTLAQHALLTNGAALVSTMLCVPTAFAQGPATTAAAQPPDDDEVTTGTPGAAPDNPLLPPGEKRRMASHPIRADSLAFKPGKGISATSEDGDFVLNLGARAQFLYTLMHPNLDEGESEYSFQVRRARVAFTGNLFDPDVKYKLELAVSPRDVDTGDGVVRTSPLLDFYADLTHLRDLSVRIGQYKVPFNRQRVISSGALQFVDRSIANAEFNLDRDIGVDLRSDDLFGLGALRYYVGVYPGGGRNSFENEDAFHLFVLGRVEVLPFGEFEDYIESDFERTGPRLSIGVAAAHVDDSPTDRGILGSTPDDEGTTDFNLFEADLIFKLYGLSILSEFFYRQGDRLPGTTVDEDGTLVISPSRSGMGFLVQGGYLIPRTPLEFALRYARIDGSSDTGDDGLTDREEYATGASYYFTHHQLKLQADYTRLVTQGEFADGTDQFRAQLQIAY